LNLGFFQPTCLSFIEESRDLNPGSLVLLILMLCVPYKLASETKGEMYDLKLA